MKRLLLPILCSCLLLNGCAIVNKFDGVGQDNTPAPAGLTPVYPQLNTHIAWVVNANSGIGNMEYLKLGPTAADGRIFTADATGVVAANSQTNGKSLWRTKIHAQITSGPSVHDGLVVVATGDAKVFALNENTGAILWHTSVSDAVFSAPAIGNGRVVLRAVDGQVIALNAQNGQQLWSYDHGAPMLVMRTGGAPQIAGNKVIVGFADGKTSALNLNDGTLVWEQIVALPTGGSPVDQMVDVAGDPIVIGNTVYVAANGNVAALNANTGDIYWQQTVSANGLAVDNRYVYVTDSNGYVFAFTRSNGSLNWQQTALSHRMISPPAITGGGIVVGDAEGYLHWLCPADGHFVARNIVEPGRKIIAAPAVVGNTVFVQAANGKLSAWRYF